ncbi:MAG: hypothetical protein U0324_39605 [Polyangiales bacterium]
MTTAAPTVRFVEPAEGAFSLTLPAGWVAQGGVSRAPGASPRPWYRAVSPGGGAELRGGDPRLPPSFVDPRFASMMGMFPPPGAVPRPYEPPTYFAEGYARQFARERGASGFAVTGVRDAATIVGDDPRPDARARTQLLLQQGAELAGVTFACPDRGLSGLVDVIIVRMMMPTGLAWMPFVTALAGPSDAWPHARATLLHIARSWQENPAWGQLQKQLQQAQHQMAMDTIAAGTRVLQVQAQSGMEAIAAHAERARIAAQASAETNATQMQGWQAQERADDERQRRAVNAVRETVDLQDPATGQVYRGAPAGFATYWTDGADRVVASQGQENPDPTRFTQAQDLDDRRKP